MAARFIRRALIVTPALALALGGISAFAGGSVDRSSYRERGDIAYESEYLASRGGPAPVTIGTASTKDVGEARKKGAAWLKAVQKKDGGWGAGSWGQDDVNAPSDVATTAMAVLALMRDGGGVETHRASIVRAVAFVNKTIEDSPKKSPEINSPGQTQPQYKLGRLVDTHLAALMLGELVGQLDAATNVAMDQAYDRVLGKVQMAQNSDGSFDKDGWAPILSSSIASSALSRGVELGKSIDEEVLSLNDRYQAAKVDADTGRFDSSAGAGVDLYSVASTLKGNNEKKKRWRDGRLVASKPAEVAQREAEDAERSEEAAVQAVTRDANNQLFAGFGSAGGEEMLSYMMISDTLVEEGGEQWTAWNDKVGGYLVGTQNGDGSWAGHHCITSRTFVTAAAMMTLGAESAANMRASRETGETPSRMGAFAPDPSTK